MHFRKIKMTKNLIQNFEIPGIKKRILSRRISSVSLISIQVPNLNPILNYFFAQIVCIYNKYIAVLQKYVKCNAVKKIRFTVLSNLKIRDIEVVKKNV